MQCEKGRAKKREKRHLGGEKERDRNRESLSWEICLNSLDRNNDAFNWRFVLYAGCKYVMWNNE